MATSKKPRKKHDKNANIKRQSDRICRNSLVLSVIGLEKYQHCKGIGKKRIQSLIDGYHALINDEKLIPKLTALREFETQIYIHQQTMARLNRAAQM